MALKFQCNAATVSGSIRALLHSMFEFRDKKLNEQFSVAAMLQFSSNKQGASCEIN